ncbi:MAG: tripartite tricarboxylate transporter permease [Deltaproteobacteria bacterium]|jgi:putative tricarboxylic transport membrane protein|nr:tripartite tricarboxylate transporter permease [Deltaproteobacteria bacterium]
MEFSLSLIVAQMLAHWWVTLAGVVAGILIGATPGLTSSNCTAIMLPFILALRPVTGVIFVISLHAGSQVGNSFPAILLNIPGTPSAAVTTIEGHALARLGQASRALGVCVFGSVFGGIFGGLASIMLIPWLAPVALRFSPVELTVIILFGIVVIGPISRGSLIKGLVSGLFGLLVSTSGPDPMWGRFRGTFGLVELYDGVPLVPALVGLMAFSELISLVFKGQTDRPTALQSITMKEILKGGLDVIKRPIESFRSSIIGLIVGIIPGAGGSVASALAYQQAAVFATKKEAPKFGKGSVNGLLAADASNNAMIGGALITLFLLAIPGSSTDAVLLVALTYHGLVMGPEFFHMNGDLAWAALSSQFAAAFFCGLCGVLLAYVMGRMVNVKLIILIPFISVLTFIGGFASMGLTFGIYVMLVCGLLGYYMKKHGYVPLAFLMGLVLGGQLEANFFRGYRMGHRSFSIFFESPIALTVWGLMLITLLSPLLRSLFAKRAPAPTPAPFPDAGTPDDQADEPLAGASGR